MSTPLRLLIVEDDERDAQLVLREIRRTHSDVTYQRVDTPEAMTAALTHDTWDLIVSDYSMPRFSALMALATMKNLKIDLPFIIVSGTVGEDIAVEALHAGAHDFVAKGKLARLLPAIDRELRESAMRVERERMKEQLLISERMASVGTLAAGVAHEINNPLAALVLNLQIVSEDLSRIADALRARVDSAADVAVEQLSDDWIAERIRSLSMPLRDAQESAERVRRIVKDLKSLSRGDDEKTGPVHLRPVLESSLRIAWNEIRHRAKLVEEYADIPPVEGNEGQLGQVFLNLIMNAAQSMPEGSADRNVLKVVLAQDDRGRVVVEIQDTGTGMSPKVLSRVFEPFFTTKPIGDGTGLGLPIVHRIVTGVGGQLLIDSTVGKGTTVRTILPVAQETFAQEAPLPLPPTITERCKILVVDDEPMLGTAVRRMLAADHDVIATTSARDALARLNDGERFDLILCDLMMPEMTGMDLHAELTRTVPDQAARMVFMTGGAFTNKARDFLSDVSNARIEKPFTKAHLLSMIQQALDRQ